MDVGDNTMGYRREGTEDTEISRGRGESRRQFKFVALLNEIFSSLEALTLLIIGKFVASV